MRKTGLIHLGLTSAMALTLSCSSHRKEAQRCIDGSNVVVEDRYCDAPIGSHGGYYPYRWYYGGSGFYTGQTVTGGSYAATPGMGTFRSSSDSSGTGSTSSSGTTRGGFGSTGSSGGHGSSGGGGE
jgi:hypothetical protein